MSGIKISFRVTCTVVCTPACWRQLRNRLVHAISVRDCVALSVRWFFSTASGTLTELALDAPT